MEQEKVLMGINEQDADYLIDNLGLKGFKVNKVGVNGRYYVAVDKVHDEPSVLTLSALILNLLKKKVLTDALDDLNINSDKILEIINNDKEWNLLSDNSIGILYSEIYKNLNNNEIIDLNSNASTHYILRRDIIMKEVKERLGDNK